MSADLVGQLERELTLLREKFHEKELPRNPPKSRLEEEAERACKRRKLKQPSKKCKCMALRLVIRPTMCMMMS